jgi:hypothetical protein
MTFVVTDHGGFFMSAENALNTIPPPEVVRERLSQSLREVKLLRSLLRLSEKAVTASQGREVIDSSGAGREAVHAG